MADVSELGRKVKAKYPGQYDDLDDADVGRRVKAKHPGAYDDFTDAPATVLPQDRQEFGRRPLSLDESLSQSARVNRGKPSRSSQVDMDTMSINPESVKQAKRAAFERRPITERTGERVYDALARGGGQLSRMARQTVGAGLGVAKGINSGDFSPVDLPAWREFEEERNRELEARRLSRPSSFATDVGEGIVESLPIAAAGYLGGAGGGLLRAGATGAGLSAAGADWENPRRALTQSAIGAVAPIVGGKAGQGIGSAVASRLAPPIAQAGARIGGELVGGAAGNVIGSGTEQLAFEGKLNPRELAKQGIIGAALNVPGAVGAGRRPARSNVSAAQPESVAQMGAGSVVPPPIRQTRQITRPAPRQTADIPRPVTSPTQRIPTAPEPVYPDAPETQEMPEIRARIAAENATTRELPVSGILAQDAPETRQSIATPIDNAREGILAPETTPRLPKATDENIAALRAEQEQLGRLAYDRRGDFTGDLRDQYNRLNAIIREYDNARAPRELAPPSSNRPERFTPPPEEIPARRAALESRTGPMPETLTEGRKVTQETQVPGGVKPAEAFKSREDARQSHFEQFGDDELVQEIRRMEDVRSRGVGGKLTAEQIKANDYDLKIAVEMQKERRRQQEAIGVDPANRIPVRAAGRQPRKIQHDRLGLVTEAENQKGVPKGKMRVDLESGGQSIIQNPRTRGNQSAAFVRSIPDEAVPEMRSGPPAPRVESGKTPSQIDYTIPAEAMPETRARPGQVMGMGLGALQPLFERGAKPKAPEPGQQPLFDAAPKQSAAKKLASNVVSAATLPRALMASADLSAPLRQGAILTLPPTQWGRAAKSGVRMIQAAIPDIKIGGRQITRSRYERLVKELNDHPDAKVGKESGLYMATDPKKGSSLQGREEDFISKWAEKIPIVKHSEQAYKTYLDSIRLETFKKYKKVIDGDKKLSFEDKHKAYKAAAEWINVASGRGSLGKTLDKAMPALSTVFFAPRYTASRIQVLNPATYAKNLSSPSGRVVLRQQMTDLVQFAGMVSATLALAKAAGAEVGTDPEDGDFLKIKIGNVRYDTLAGLQQVMRLFYRTGKDVGKASIGQKSDQGEGALEIAGKFGRSKLAPIPSFFTDALARKDFTGRDFEVGRGVRERVLPLMWKDFADAYQREGVGGAAKLSPGFLGLGVQDFAKKPGVIGQKNEAYIGELKRLGVTPGESVQRLKNEPENLHKERAGKIESWRDEYGAALIQHPMYQRLSDEQKKAAVESLHGRISEQANQRRPNLRQFNPAPIIRGLRSGERSRRRTDRDKIYVAPR